MDVYKEDVRRRRRTQQTICRRKVNEYKVNVNSLRSALLPLNESITSERPFSKTHYALPNISVAIRKWTTGKFLFLKQKQDSYKELSTDKDRAEKASEDKYKTDYSGRVMLASFR